MGKQAMNLQKYVVWDGEIELDYCEDPIYHDCVITYDGGRLSVQERRSSMLARGIVPTIVFACKSGQTAIEQSFDGVVRGVFSYFWQGVLKNEPSVTFREAVCRTNEAIKKLGLAQRCEIVCRVDVLDMVVSGTLQGETHSLCVFDMCRTRA